MNSRVPAQLNLMIKHEGKSKEELDIRAAPGSVAGEKPPPNSVRGVAPAGLAARPSALRWRGVRVGLSVGVQLAGLWYVANRLLDTG